MPYFALIIMFYHVKIACYQPLAAKSKEIVAGREDSGGERQREGVAARGSGGEREKQVPQESSRSMPENRHRSNDAHHNLFVFGGCAKS